MLIFKKKKKKYVDKPILFGLSVQLSKSTPKHPSRLNPVAAVTPSGQHPNSDTWHESVIVRSEVDETGINSSVVTVIVFNQYKLFS